MLCIKLVLSLFCFTITFAANEWIKNQENGKKYLFYSDCISSKSVAEETCINDLGGTGLAIPATSSIRSFLINNVYDETASKSSCASWNGFWTDGTLNFDTKTVLFSNGQSIPFDSINWDHSWNEPSSAQYCFGFRGISKQWHSVVCNEKNGFFCELDEPTTTHPTTVNPTASTTAHPITVHPTTVHPTTAHPTTTHPTTAHPTTAHPTTAHPTTAHPTTAHPTTAHPTTSSTTSTREYTCDGSECVCQCDIATVSICIDTDTVKQTFIEKEQIDHDGLNNNDTTNNKVTTSETSETLILYGIIVILLIIILLLVFVLIIQMNKTKKLLTSRYQIASHVDNEEKEANVSPQTDETQQITDV